MHGLSKELYFQAVSVFVTGRKIGAGSKQDQNRNSRKIDVCLINPKAYSELGKASKMELFSKIVYS